MFLVSPHKLWNGRTAAVALLVLIVAFLFASNTGVRAIRRAHEPANFVLVDPQPGPTDWPGWRGIGGTNVSAESRPPLSWSANDNTAWQVTLPGRGHASPSLWGDQIFVTTAEARRQTLSLFSFDRESGRSLWQSELHHGDLPSGHAKNSSASPSPTCDGQFVFVASAVNGSVWVTAVDLAGRIAWQTAAGPFQAKWGYGSSPTLYKSLVIVAVDNKGAAFNRLRATSYLAALHRQTGEIVWRIERPPGDSFGTPIVAHVAGRNQLVIAGKGLVASYDPATGETLWTCRWSAERAANTVAFDDEHVFATARTPQKELLCIRADGQGEVSGTHVVWREKQLASEVPSPVVYENWLYLLTDDGILACLDAATGKLAWKQRLSGQFSASPLIAGDRVYCCNEEGITFVVTLGASGEVVAENTLIEGQFASPIASGNRLYLRTLNGLHCVMTRGDVIEQNDPLERDRSSDTDAGPVAGKIEAGRRQF